MLDFKDEKKLVLEYFNSINEAKSENLIDIISKYTSDEFKMRCTHPFNELTGANKLLIICGCQLKIHLNLFNEGWIFFMLV